MFISVFLGFLLIVQRTLDLWLPQAAITGAGADPEALAGDQTSPVSRNNSAAVSLQPIRMCADLTGDEVVDVADIVMMLRIAFELAEATPEQLVDGDLNHDRSVDVFDATIGFRHIVGLTEITDCGPVVLTVGTAVGVPGSRVALPISLNTKTVPVRSVRVRLGYDGAKLTNAVAAKGPALPPAWTLDSNSPTPGELRLLSFHIGTGQTLDGVILIVTFTIPTLLTSGEVPVEVLLHEIHSAAWEKALNLKVIDGAITISLP